MYMHIDKYGIITIEKAATAQTHRSSIPNRLHAPPPQQLQHPEKPVNSSTSQQAACEGSFSVPTTNRQQYPRWHILRRGEDTSEHRSRRAQRTACIRTWTAPAW